MTPNTTMIQLLHKIVSKEPQVEANLIEDDFIAVEAGNELIQLYSVTENLETRELITDFMKEAGYTWLRKLLTRDMTPAHH